MADFLLYQDRNGCRMSTPIQSGRGPGTSEVTMRSQFSTTTLHRGLRYATLTLMLLAALTHLAQAQTYSVIYNFTGGQDGATPLAGVSLDRAGNLYGTTSGGGFTGGRCSGPGLHGCGTVYDLKHNASPPRSR